MPININKRSDVNSVNGKVGDVVLNASDIGALSKDTKIPTKTSELINDSNYVSDDNYIHTDNNYTNEDKDKLNNIANGAEVNVQSDWAETDGTQDSFIKNKPFIPSKTSELSNDSNFVVDADYKHTDNNYTTADKNSVATIANKVDKVEGKGLSTNDLTDELKVDYDDAVLQAHTHSNKTILDNTTASYTTEEKTKLSGIENNAQKNTVIGVKGGAETDYRAGNVNITKTNIGLENVANERQWSATNHPTTMNGYGITDGVSSTDYNTLKGRVDTNEDNIAMLDSDVEGLNTDVGTLKTDMTTVKGAVTTIQDDYVPKTRKVNGKSLSADITLSASDVKAIPISQKGTSNGVAELDGNGLVPSSQLPSYVDDVLEYDTKTDFPTNGESGKIYIATDTNLQYRWTGTQYAEISSSLALGETSSTAYRGDRGKIAYDHSQKASGNPHNVTKNDVGLSNVPNVATNDQTPTFTESTTLTKLTSGEKLSVAFGKISKSITDLINHIANKNNPHEVTKTQVGLGNVGNFKAVSTVASQRLTDTEKANARTNIGAGTSNFSGSYSDLTNKPTIPTVGNGTVTITQNGTSKGTFTMNQNGNTTIALTDTNIDTWRPQPDWNATSGDAVIKNKPTLGTAAAKNVPASGNAATSEVVLGSDTRLSNARPASDVAAWAKASTKPSYTKSEIGLGNVDNTADANKSVKTSKKLETYKEGSTTETYGNDYPVYAQWRDGSHVRMKCDNYTVETDYANSAGNSAKVNNHTVKSDVPENAKFTDTWRPLGTTADTACAGNDSRLSNARPASDVYAWAKAATKPSYTKSEIGLGNVDNTADANKSVKTSKKLETYKEGSTTETYGNDYPVYAQWRDGSHVRMKCDNYTVETDYANSAGNSAKVNNHTVKSDVPENAKFTDTWRPLGTTADTACAGNDSRLSNARPASDVYSWAKAATKPSYTKSEVGLGNVDNTADSAKSVKYATNAGSANNLNITASIASGNGNTTGYRLMSSVSIGSWSNYRSVFLVKSRHEGAGILIVSVGCNDYTVSQANGYAEIRYFGTRDISSDSYQIYFSSDGKTAYLFEKYWDYSTLHITLLNGDFTVTNGTWMTSIDTSKYGALKAQTQINNSTTVNWHTVNADVPENAKFTDTWRPLGTTADTACAGNDSRLSNARPASDVYAWAKAATKPSYTKSEIGLGNVDNTADANKSVKNADKLYNKSNDYYGVWLGGMTISKGTGAGMSQSVAEDPLHRYIKPTSIIDIYYDDNSVQYASEIGMLYNIQESGGIYYLSIAPKKDVVKQDIVIQNILVRNP